MGRSVAGFLLKIVPSKNTDSFDSSNVYKKKARNKFEYITPILHHANECLASVGGFFWLLSSEENISEYISSFLSHCLSLALKIIPICLCLLVLL